MVKLMAIAEVQGELQRSPDLAVGECGTSVTWTPPAG